MSTNEKTIRLVVVDDEPTLRDSVQKVLRLKGYQVEQADCVSEALEMIEKGRPLDLIIADLIMPQVGGMELLKITKDRWPEIPVLIITGYASIDSAVEATRLGAAGYLPKPFTPDELEQAVGNIIKGPWKALEEKADDEQQEKTESNGKIDVDMPFDAEEVTRLTSPRYVERLTRSDMPLAQIGSRPIAADFCSMGGRSCKRYAAKGACQMDECPLITAGRKRRLLEGGVRPLADDSIDADMPFSASEVAALTCEAYVACVGRDGFPNLGFWPKKKLAVGRVLVVDDEVVVVNSIRESLIREGYVVDEAFSGREAIARVLTQEYDMVLLDMRMPDLGGLELLPKIKQHRPDLQVVIVTGYASIDTAVEAIQLGASDYLGKPFTPEELYGITNRVLKRKVA